MALDTFKAQLKAYLTGKKVNLSQSRIDAFAAKLDKKNPDITDAAAHDTAIADMDELLGFADIAKQDDKVRTLEAKAKPKPATTEETEETTEEETTETEEKTKTKGDRTPAWAKALIAEVQTLKAEKQTQSITEKIKANPKMKDVPEWVWKKRALPTKDEELEAFVDDVAADYETVAPTGGASRPPTSGGGDTAGKADPAVEAFAARKLAEVKGTTTQTK